MPLAVQCQDENTVSLGFASPTDLRGLALQGQFSGSHVPGQRHWMLLSLLLKGHLQLAPSRVKVLPPSDAMAD